MKLRLLKVVVQPVFAIDDGENLTEQAAEAISIPAALWPEYAATGFAQQVEQLRQKVEGQAPAPKPEHHGRAMRSPKAKRV